jgi:hypothetical protein
MKGQHEGVKQSLLLSAPPRELSQEEEFEEMSIPSREEGSEDDGTVKMYSFVLGDPSPMLMLRKDPEDRGGTVIAFSEAPPEMSALPQQSEGDS